MKPNNLNEAIDYYINQPHLFIHQSALHTELEKVSRNQFVLRHLERQMKQTLQTSERVTALSREFILAQGVETL